MMNHGEREIIDNRLYTQNHLEQTQFSHLLRRRVSFYFTRKWFVYLMSLRRDISCDPHSISRSRLRQHGDIMCAT